MQCQRGVLELRTVEPNARNLRNTAVDIENGDALRTFNGFD